MNYPTYLVINPLHVEYTYIPHEFKIIPPDDWWDGTCIKIPKPHNYWKRAWKKELTLDYKKQYF